MAVVIAPLALAHPYTATINKSAAGTGDTDPYTITITNNYTGSQKATKAEITIPAGWAVSGLSATATDGTWPTPQVSAGKIVVAATSGGIGYHKTLSISFSGSAGSSGAAICAGGSSVWTPKVTNGGTTFVRSGSAPTVTVTKPGRLKSFAWSVIGSPQKAGVGFGGMVTARDGCGNVKTDYVGSHGVLSGLGISPAPASKGPVGVGAQSFSAGVATVAVTGYLAQTTNLKLDDGSVTASSNSFTITPGDLFSFAWSAIGDPQKAGVGFGGTVTAYDAYSNLKYDYVGSHGVLSGLGISPAPASKGPVGVGAQSFSAGVATVAVTGYLAQTTNLKLDDGSVTASSNSFTITPGDLFSFAWSAIGDPQKAGVGFGGTVTAYDAYSNLKYDYVGSHGVLSGLGISPSGKSPDGVDVPPVFSAGVATVAVTGYLAQTTALSIADGLVNQLSNTFTITHGDFTLTFVTQPGNADINATIPSTTSSQPITLSAQDSWGNRPSAASTIAVSTNPVTTVAGTISKGPAGGVATFDNLSIAAPATYTMQAALSGDGPTVVATSNQFTITVPGVSCTAPCTAATLKDTAAGSSSTVGVAGAAGGTLSVSFVGSSSFCNGFVPIGSITNFQVYNTGGALPSFDITWQAQFSNTLNASLITRALKDVNICLGTTNLTPGYTGPGFRVKGGGTAPPQTDGFFWGLLPTCDDDEHEHEVMGPCIYSKRKVSVTINGQTNGTVTVKFKVPAPWDARYGGG